MNKILLAIKDKNVFELYTNIPKGYTLTDRQKDILNYWRPPVASFSKQCSVCGGMYLAGCLQLCGDSFCGYQDEVKVKT